jgi:hypothetical protein
MVPLTPEEIAELRQHLADLDISDESKDELIRLIDSIAISLVEQALGLSPVQLSLSARANYAFLGASDCDSLEKSETLNLLTSPMMSRERARKTTAAPGHIPRGRLRPGDKNEQKNQSKGSDLLPRQYQEAGTGRQWP